MVDNIDIGGLELLFAPHTVVNDIITPSGLRDREHDRTAPIASIIRRKTTSETVTAELSAFFAQQENDQEIFNEIESFARPPLFSVGSVEYPARIYSSFPPSGQATKDKTVVLADEKISNAADLKGTYSIISLNTQRIMPQSFDGDMLTVFMNGLPTHEISRCVPFIDIRTLSYSPAIAQNGALTGVSLYKGIIGQSSSDPIASALAGSIDPNVVIGADILAAQGMELFLSPQTLISPSDSVRTVIDKIRPLLSLESMTIESNSMQSGITAFKTGKLVFILHDRSRMSDMADFLNPDFYSNVFFEISYGWSYAGSSTNDSTNPYRRFIESLNRTELFTIQKTSYAMRDDGSVGIDVIIYMNGARELNRLKLSDGDIALVDSQKKLLELSARIKELRNSIPALAGHEPMLKEIRAAQVLLGAENPETFIEPDPDIEATLDEIFHDFQKLQSKDEKLVKLIDQYKAVYGESISDPENNAGAVIEQVRAGINGIVQSTIHDATTSPTDPFLEISGVQERISKGGDIAAEIEANADAIKNRINKLESDSRSARNKKDAQRLKNQAAMLKNTQGVVSNFQRHYVSFGKLLIHFIIKPILSQRKFDDVQILCFPLNGDAGLAANVNISSFIIDVSEFTTIFSQRSRQRGSPDMQLTEFLEFITTTFIDDPRSYMYGQQKRYKQRDLQNPSAAAELKDEKTKKGSKKQSDIEKINDGLDKRSFRLPNVEYFIDSFLTKNKDGTQSRVLKILIFDAHASPYSENVELLKKTRDNAIFDKSIIEKISQGENESRELAYGANAVKEFITKTMPHAVFGTAGSALMNASLTNFQDSSFATVHMIRSGPSRTNTTRGLNEGTLPMRILPSTVDVSMIGCPILEFGQQLFVDFSTLTTADQIYGVMGVTHNFESGKFTTTAKLQAVDAWGTYETFAEKINNASR